MLQLASTCASLFVNIYHLALAVEKTPSHFAGDFKQLMRRTVENA